MEHGLLEAGAGARYNDVPAVTFVIDAGLFRAYPLYVELETHNPLSRGQTVAHPVTDQGSLGDRAANATVCMEVDAPSLTGLFTKRIVGYQPRAISSESIPEGRPVDG